MDIGKLHVVMVHFPIALAVCAGLADLLWLITRKENFKNAGLYCLVLAAISAVPAVVTGLIKAGGKEFAGEYVAIAETHEHLGIACLVIAIVAAVIRLASHGQLKKWPLAGYCVLIIALVVGIAITGHYGGMLVHGKDLLSDVF